jgi:hypothetical protein
MRSVIFRDVAVVGGAKTHHYRISDIEQGIMNDEVRKPLPSTFEIPCSLFRGSCSLFDILPVGVLGQDRADGNFQFRGRLIAKAPSFDIRNYLFAIPRFMQV